MIRASMAAAMSLALATLSVSAALASSGNDAITPAPAAHADDAVIAKGRELFATGSCNACHTLADAEAAGAVGPGFDGNTGLSKDFIVNRVTNGQGAMPSFGGQFSASEIDELATYIMAAKAN